PSPIASGAVVRMSNATLAMLAFPKRAPRQAAPESNHRERRERAAATATNGASSPSGALWTVRLRATAENEKGRAGGRRAPLAVLEAPELRSGISCRW